MPQGMCRALTGPAGQALAGTLEATLQSAQQRELFNVLQSYKDVLFTCRPYPVRCVACSYLPILRFTF